MKYYEVTLYLWNESTFACAVEVDSLLQAIHKACEEVGVTIDDVKDVMTNFLCIRD
jgi:hypothetical protein